MGNEARVGRSELALAAGTAVNAVFAYSFVTAWRRKGAPFVPSAQAKIDAIFGRGGVLQSHVRRRQHAVDLGSGGGAFVRAAVRNGHFARATGYELNPALVLFARIQSVLARGEHFRLCSLWDADLSDADLVFVYGVPSIMVALEAKLTRELPLDAVVVSNLFRFPDVEENRTTALVEEASQWVDAGLQNLSMDDSGMLFVYRHRAKSSE